MAELKARDIMTADPATIGPDASVTDAAKLMTERSIGALPVISEGRLIGIVTEADLIMRDVKLEYPTYIQFLDSVITFPGARTKFEGELKKAVAAKVADVMTADPVTVGLDASIDDVATLLAEQEVSRLPVMDGDTVAGIVSKHDVVKAIARGLT